MNKSYQQLELLITRLAQHKDSVIREDFGRIEELCYLIKEFMYKEIDNKELKRFKDFCGDEYIPAVDYGFKQTEQMLDYLAEELEKIKNKPNA